MDNMDNEWYTVTSAPQGGRVHKESLAGAMQTPRGQGPTRGFIAGQGHSRTCSMDVGQHLGMAPGPLTIWATATLTHQLSRPHLPTVPVTREPGWHRVYQVLPAFGPLLVLSVI